MFRRLFRLRLIPRDVFNKFDHLIDMQTRTVDMLNRLSRESAGLHREAEEIGSQKELVKRLAALQDDLVRRAIADRRATTDASSVEDTSTRLEVLAEEVRQVAAAVQSVSAVVARQQDALQRIMDVLGDHTPVAN